ncbi:MAG: hypothetical protein HYV09_24675 [Deltaproteobacteria bacterium]|nr:hypothetical protein [Deltaproteobacteria bacterium]
MDPRILSNTSRDERPIAEQWRPKVTEYLTLTQVAHLLGMPGGDYARKKLLRMLRAKERLLGVDIMLRLGGSATRPVHYVTLALLHEHCPELFVRRDEIVELLRERFEEIETQMCELRRADRTLASAVRRVSPGTDVELDDEMEDDAA